MKCHGCGTRVECPVCAAQLEKKARRLARTGDAAAKIVAHVSRRTRVPVDHIRSAIRDEVTVNARYLAIWLCRRILKMSEPKLGDVFERDHSTIHHALDKMTERLIVQPQLAREVREMQRELSA